MVNSTCIESSQKHFILAIIITGGCPGCTFSFDRSVELLRENGSYWCSLPDMTDDRFRHTQSGLITCGGLYTGKTCLSFTDGQWITSHQLQYDRNDHSSWMSQHGVVLMGGEYSRNATELLTDGGSTPAFTLEYPT